MEAAQEMGFSVMEMNEHSARLGDDRSRHPAKLRQTTLVASPPQG